MFTELQRELFLSEVNNRETIAAIEANKCHVLSSKTNRKVLAVFSFSGEDLGLVHKYSDYDCESYITKMGSQHSPIHITMSQLQSQLQKWL